MLRILCSLVRRRILPYPTLAELRNHRQQVSRAAEFGDHISAQITASTSFGVRDMWRLLKTFHKTTKSNPKDPSQHLDGSQDRYIPNPEGILEDKGDSQETKDLKRTGVLVLNQVADLHERVTNIPPILWDVPTDAEYAMELIAARVAAGQDVNPPKVRGHGTRHTAGGTENYTGLRNSKNYSENKSKSVDWKKWGERAAISKTWVENGKHLLRGRKNQASVGSDAQKRMAVPVAPEHATAMITEIPQSSMTKTTSSILSELAADHEAGSPQFVEAHSESFPAQHSSGPGLITLTATILLFTPLMSNIPKFVISLMRLRGVKKMGLLKGLQMKFSSDDGLQEIEEKFRWVGGRDELFARLVGTGKRQWLMPQ
ncbi:hypothetical protein H0H81_005310 [Sphagnurus paluster]|uniref:Uncharacterized protein n=1 Tax=Sphagnurus paluster TaxID=117069 RepID=A0A9P7K5N6_9AGAR|nr:hypothetical protein H0H81_005310 [Sphagnurus paluster]